jgi:hypothetical protein
LKKYEENWKDTLNNVNSLLEQWADNLKSKYQNTISEALSGLEDEIN